MSKGRQLAKPPSIKINGVRIPHTKELKYLGLIIDQGMKWNQHIDYACAKAIKQANLLCYLAGKDWGIGRNNLINIYRQAIEPTVLYGAPIWGNAASRAHIKRALQKVQRICLLRITGAYKTALTAALQVLAGIPPLFLKAMANMASWKLTHLPTSDSKKKELINYLNIGLLPNLNIDNLCHPTDFVSHPAVSINFHPAHYPHFNIDINMDVPAPNYIIFTDGSSSSSGTGAGLVLYDNKKGRAIHSANFRLAPFCSVMQAELFAIYQALCYVNNNRSLDNNRITICTDSRAALHGIARGSLGGKLHALIIKEITKCNRTIIDFKWTRAHSGVPGNEEADRLAKEATLGTSDIVFSDIPLVATKKLVWNTMIQMWQREWEEASTGRNTFGFFPNITQRLNLNHVLSDFITSQLFTGHGNFRAYLHRFGHEVSPDCQCEEDQPQDNLHLIFQCSRFDEQRSKLLQETLKISHRWPCNPTTLVNNKKIYSELTSFVKATGVLDVRNRNS
ncbi:uncharacterized protein LOC111614930 [Centruroides sculpturatus]|uniref:uncharacterized protein LOC111614930 n=1 Tax=Centruroides sculpturatus TaxID=218467 RepID=UPI000C6E44BE|nr:uncharacterized protein LOC111614930 [Centruroides sculpturatus]